MLKNHMMRQPFFLPFVLLLVACGNNSDICESDRDCRDGLICLDGECRTASERDESGVAIDDPIKKDSGTTTDSSSSLEQSGSQTGKGGSGSNGENEGTDSTPTSGCETDYDCKGDRICEDRKCVDPSKTNIDAGRDAGSAGTGATGGVVETGGSGGSQNDEKDGTVDAGNKDAGGDAKVFDGSADSSVVTTLEPVIPAITGDCPTFVSGEFSFQGFTGLMEVGVKGSGEGALLFYWHGYSTSASSYSAIGLSNRNRITEAGGIIVSPDGPADGEEDGGLCSGNGSFGDTVTWEIVDQIVACAVRDYAIDPHRIYATGCDVGGLQSGCMALRRSSYVAAVATNSGGLAVVPIAYQDPTRIPAVITMHADPDVLVTLNLAAASNSLCARTKNAGGFAVNCNHGGLQCGAPDSLYRSAFDFLFDHPIGDTPKPSSLPSSYPSYCSIY